MSRKEERLRGGLIYLKEHRDGKGRWRRFPFYYTLLALTEIPGRQSDDEIRYAAPGLERMLKRKERGDRYDRRRRAVAETLLGRV
ncbi:MAG TPA: hypothetical protein PLV45_04290 [bacterium]|nr:hypothetical protein [bacterium]